MNLSGELTFIVMRALAMRTGAEDLATTGSAVR
ncbi:hypothetical protein J2W54_002242 [Rhodococcus fascians]|nr:hypothetical protein [Rhodococcus sp. 3258]MDR6931860.1 hypothetical protein [Rhodococcus fascians]